MSQKLVVARQRGWPGALLWGAVVLLAIVLIVMGLERTLVPGFVRDTESVARVGIGNRYLFAGTTVSAAAAVWSYFRDNRYWATAFVGAPAVVIGGAALLMPWSPAPHVAALFALPVAVAGLIDGLAHRGSYRLR
ncbi:hypothetical protein [Arthrobacter oryzae]|uniref:Uncharacterized protein n=2 Tax=Arthrobacter TaxID=1663 RepID=A0A3N0BV23_9MICC|nr:hypothetical protein [Arthrobacter oryzae]RNL52957.1 hypothetical protein D7003_13350 [Arthrobacter oryzae]